MQVINTPSRTEPYPRWFALTAFLMLVLACIARGKEPISFSLSGAAPPTAKRGMEFSIQQAEAPAAQSPRIKFSMTDAPEMANVPKSAPAATIAVPKPIAEPECGTDREANRVLVIVATKLATEYRFVKAANCPDGRCPLIRQAVKLTTDASDRLLAELARLPKNWKWGEDDCNHFEIIDADAKEHAKLLTQLAVKRSELPLLVKECDPIVRKPGTGLKMADLAKLWNQWFAEPRPTKSEHGACLPRLGADGRTSWTWPGSLRDHLIDPRGPHHLPAAVVDRWTFDEQKRFHNWHHDKLTGTVSQSKPAPRLYQAGTRNGNIERRAWQIAASVPRSVRPSFDSNVSPKKESANCGSGKNANAAA